MFCEERKVIITGAGSGLGRAYAQAFAAEGAHVLVNDVSQEAAQSVVEQITSLGGSAVANISDVSDYTAAEKMIEQAVGIFGGLDVVVNNAGIVRDRMFVSTSEQEWDDVIRIHLKGHYCVTKHACSYWRSLAKQGQQLDARIINTSSGAGIQGSIGQSNYSAAKGGIATLTLVQAAELGRYGITANALVPAARTGITSGVAAMDEMMKPPEDGSFDYYDPNNIAPLVLWLGSTHSAPYSGYIFEIEGGKIGVAEGWHSGYLEDKARRWTVAEVAKTLPELIANSRPPAKVFGS